MVVIDPSPVVCPSPRTASAIRTGALQPPAGLGYWTGASWRKPGDGEVEEYAKADHRDDHGERSYVPSLQGRRARLLSFAMNGGYVTTPLAFRLDRLAVSWWLL